MAKTLSIIVPVFNAESTLERCILSVVSQTFEDWEMILVDDGSTDRSGTICDKWGSKDDRIRTIHTDNRGPSAARNAGLDIASGSFIAFIDSDDYIQQGLYDDVINKMRGDVDVLEYGWIRKGVSHILQSKSFTTAKEYWEESRGWTHGYVWNKIFRREIIGDTRFCDTDIAEDMIFVVDILRKHPRVVTVSFVGYNYVVSEGGLSLDTSVRCISKLLGAELYAARKMRTMPVSRNGLNLYYYVCCRIYDIVRFSLFKNMDRKTKH